MIYTSADIIPAKLFFRIEATGDISLLSTKKRPKVFLQQIWEDIQEENNRISSNKTIGKVLNLSRNIEKLSARLEKVTLACHVLKSVRDKELIEMLKDDGYKFTYEKAKTERQSRRMYLSDVARIEKQATSLVIKIDNLKTKLPDQEKEKSTEEVTFDETVLGYSTLCGAGFIDTNAITLTQYYALINTGNKKMKALQAQTTKTPKNGR